MDILMFGFGEDWPAWERSGFRGRVPNLLKAFSNNKGVGKILFINNPATILRAVKNIVLKQKWGTKHGRFIRLSRFSYLMEVHEKIYTLDWIGWQIFIEKGLWMDITKGLNSKHLLRLIKKALIALDMKNILIWTENPFIHNLIRALNEEFFIYDSVDNWLEHPYLKRYFSKVNYAYNQMSKKADLITVVSHQLKDFFESRGAQKVAFIPNAVDFQHYSRQNSRSYDIPGDIKSIGRPILGFVGILSNDIDFELLKYLAETHPDWNIVLIGREIEGTKSGLIRGIKNIYLLGYKSPEIIPDYLGYFDLCICIYKMNASSNSKDPMKLYEYLTSGKPIISTDIEEVSKLKDVVVIVKTKEEFVQKIGEVLITDTEESRKRRLAVAQENNWSERTKSVFGIIEANKNYILDLSVVIVNWNTRDLLRNCLNSIYKNIRDIKYEVIVIDNFSTDGSVDMLKSDFPQVNLIANNENVGFGRANNQGFKISKGRHILFLNSDTIIISDKIVDLIGFLESHLDIGVIGPKILNSDNTTQISCQGFPRLWWILLSSLGLLRFLPQKIKLKFNCYFHNFDASCYVDSVGGACVLIKRKVFALIGGFDEDFFMYGEDLDLGYRALKYDFKSYFLNMPFIIHLQNQSGAKKWDSFSRLKENYRSLRLFCYKHYAGKVGVFMFRFMTCCGSLVRAGLYGLAYLFTGNQRCRNNMELNKNIFLINFKNRFI